MLNSHVVEAPCSAASPSLKYLTRRERGLILLQLNFENNSFDFKELTCVLTACLIHEYRPTYSDFSERHRHTPT
jgi:hypothetical protein